MKNLTRFMLLGLLVTTMTLIHAQEDAAPPYRIIGYYAGWNIYNDNGYMVTDIPGDKITHINYAFVNISDEGECILGDEWGDTQFPYPGDAEDQALKGNFNQLKLLKEANPGLQTLFSVGGWSWSEKFSDVALTEASRAKFAASCVAFMKQYGFDGIDLDWEYPVSGGEADNITRPEDKENFTLLLAETRAQLDAAGEADGRHYLLTIAVPAGNATYDNYEMDKIHLYLDWINLMAYDFAGGWSAVTGWLAALRNPNGLAGDTTVQGYLAAGTPPEKISLGVPFYGRGWTGVPATDNGVGQPYTGLYGAGDGSVNYRDLPDLQILVDEEAQASWVYDADEGIMISYDSPDVLAAKADYVRETGLGGIMIWELGGDDDDHTLLNALYGALQKPE